MVSVVFQGTAEDVQREMTSLDFKITSKQAERLLKKCSPKISSAMLEAAKDVIREEVEMFWLDQEDRQLK